MTMVQILLPYMVLRFTGHEARPNEYLRAPSRSEPSFVAFVRSTCRYHAWHRQVRCSFHSGDGFYSRPPWSVVPPPDVTTSRLLYQRSLNWGAAAALSVVLHSSYRAAYYAFKVVFGLDNLR